MARKGEKSHEDIEGGLRHPPTADESDESACFSDTENQSWHTPHHSRCDIDGALELYRNSCVSDCSIEVDLENGSPETKVVNLSKVEKDCRICHLSLHSGGGQESGIPIELGCSCKNDLAAAHKQCAETWFKIKGNKTCEICGTIAKNVVGNSETEFIEQWNESNNTAPPAPPSETRSFWRGHRFLNFLLACMVFAFFISWLFHFNVPG